MKKVENPARQRVADPLDGLQIGKTCARHPFSGPEMGEKCLFALGAYARHLFERTGPYRFGPALAVAADVSMALRSRGWSPYALRLDPEQNAWIAFVMDWRRAA